MVLTRVCGRQQMTRRMQTARRSETVAEKSAHALWIESTCFRFGRGKLQFICDGLNLFDCLSKWSSRVCLAEEVVDLYSRQREVM